MNRKGEGKKTDASTDRKAKRGIKREENEVLRGKKEDEDEEKPHNYQ